MFISYFPFFIQFVQIKTLFYLKISMDYNILVVANFIEGICCRPLIQEDLFCLFFEKDPARDKPMILKISGSVGWSWI